MTSTPFPFFVGLPGPDKKITFKDAEFRFTTKSARQIERASGSNVDVLLARGQSVELMVLLVCYGLTWNDDEMTEEKAVDLIDEFVDAGGSTRELLRTLYVALTQSGVYGKPEDNTKKGKKAAKGSERPTAA